MTRNDIIAKAIENNEIALDLAGQIMMLGDREIKRTLDNNEIALDLAGQLLMAK